MLVYYCRDACTEERPCHWQIERQQAEEDRARQEARELRRYRKSLVFKVRAPYVVCIPRRDC